MERDASLRLTDRSVKESTKPALLVGEATPGSNAGPTVARPAADFPRNPF